MVKVTFKPWEEIIVHEAIRYSLEDLVKLLIIGVAPGSIAPPLRWTNGVIFNYIAMPPTDDVVREQLEGKIHWPIVQWASMPQYKKEILIEEINARIPVVDVSGNAILRAVVDALKEQPGKSQLDQPKDDIAECEKKPDELEEGQRKQRQRRER